MRGGGGSLQRRLALRIGLLFLVTMVAALGFAVLRVQAVGPAFDRRSLESQLDTLAEAPLAAPAPLYTGEEKAPLYAVADATGALLAASPGADGPGLLAHAPKSGNGFFQYRPPERDGGERPALRDGFAATRTIDGRALRLLVVEGLNPDDELLSLMADEASDDLLFVGIPFTLLAGLVGVATVRGSLRVVSQVSDTAEAIGIAPPGLRLDRPDIPRELRPMVRAFDGVLDRLEAAIDAQRRFTAEAAHQFRTPLAIALARLDQADDGCRPLAAALRGDLAQLEHLVRQMLATAQAEAGLYPAAAELVDARLLVEDVVERLLPLCFARKLDLGVEGEGSFSILGNRAALDGMLSNLIENALEHSPHGGVVDIIVDGARRCIAVTDQGPGIPPALRERVFERFFSGEKPMGRKGTGLGLVIARSIARRHGADITISDNTGGGSVFTLSWPPSTEEVI